MEEDVTVIPRQASVRTSDRLVLQLGRGVGERDGCEIVDLTDEKYAELQAALAQPNGGVLLAADGTITVLPPVPPPLIYSSAIPLSGRVTTTNATPAELWRLPLAQLTGYDLSATIMGVDNGNGAVKKLVTSQTVKRLNAAPLNVGAATVVANHADAAASAWAVAVSFAGNDLVVTVTGAAGRTIDWHVSGTMTTFTPSGVAT